MRFPTKVVLGFLLGGVAADWTTKVYDVIVVGAGPAGIIGMCCIVSLLLFSLCLLNSRFTTRSDFLPLRLNDLEVWSCQYQK